MDENSVSFQMFLILVAFITLGSESHVCVQAMSKLHLDVCSFVFFGGGGACAEAKIWRFFFQ